MKPRQCRVAFVHDAGRIDDHQFPEDRSVRRQGRGVFQNLLERKFVCPGKRDTIGQRFYLPADFFLPELLNGRSTDDHHYLFSVRQHLQDVLDGIEIIDADRNHGIVWREHGELHAPLVHRRKHHGGAGKQILPMPLHERGRRRADAYDQVERFLGMEGAKVLDKRRLGVFIA